MSIGSELALANELRELAGQIAVLRERVEDRDEKIENDVEALFQDGWHRVSPKLDALEARVNALEAAQERDGEAKA